MERLQEQLLQERDLRAALEAGLEVPEDDHKVSFWTVINHPGTIIINKSVYWMIILKVKQEHEEIPEAKQNADDHDCCLMSDRPQL